MQFNKEEFKAFREEMKKAVEGVERKFGIEIEFGSIKYEENSFEVKTKVSNGTVEKRRENEFKKYAKLYNLDPSVYRKPFIYKGLQHRIIGLERTRRKYPMLIESETGETFLMTVDSVKKLLGVD